MAGSCSDSMGHMIMCSWVTTYYCHYSPLEVCIALLGFLHEKRESPVLESPEYIYTAVTAVCNYVQCNTKSYLHSFGMKYIPLCSYYVFFGMGILFTHYYAMTVGVRGIFLCCAETSVCVVGLPCPQDGTGSPWAKKAVPPLPPPQLQAGNYL